MANKVTNLTLPSGETVEIQDSHAVTLDENIDIQGTFDFGKITGYGNYNVPANALNAPSGVSVTNGILKVIYDHNKPIQVYLHRVTNQIFIRSLGDNGSWSDWVDIMATTELQSQIDTNGATIAKETQDRIKEDKALSSLISTETTNRNKADTTLHNSINTVSSNLTKETNARVTAVSSINSNIESLQNTASSQAETIKALNNSVNDLSSKTDWKLLKQVTGQTSVSLPMGWNELYIGINFSNKIYYTFYVPKLFVTGSTGIQIVNTYPSDSNGYCNISVSTDTYKLNSCTNETTTVVSSAISFVYYR